MLRSRCKITAEPDFLTLHEPYRIIVDRWIVPDEDKAVALRALDEALPPPDVETASMLALRLIAKTKQRKESLEMAAVRQSEFVIVIRDYPAYVGEFVVADWDRREPPESDFTPSCAELRRAMEDAAQPFVTLRRELLTPREAAAAS